MTRSDKRKRELQRMEDELHPMDQWLRRHLGALHDEVLDQPLPSELKALALELEKKLRSACADDDVDKSQ